MLNINIYKMMIDTGLDKKELTYKEFVRITRCEEYHEYSMFKNNYLAWRRTYDYRLKIMLERNEEYKKIRLENLEISIRERRDKTQTWGCEEIANTTMTAIYEAIEEYKQYTAYEW